MMPPQFLANNFRTSSSEIAMIELIRCNKIPKDTKIQVALYLSNEDKQREFAFLYLKLMQERYKCNWLAAVGYYHGGTKKQREKYIQKIKRNI